MAIGAVVDLVCTHWGTREDNLDMRKYKHIVAETSCPSALHAKAENLLEYMGDGLPFYLRSEFLAINECGSLLAGCSNIKHDL